MQRHYRLGSIILYWDSNEKEGLRNLDKGSLDRIFSIADAKDKAIKIEDYAE